MSAVRDDFLAAYSDSSLTGIISHKSPSPPNFGAVSIDTLYGKKVKLTVNEKLTDYCLDVTLLASDSAANYPGVYNGVRVFYYTYVCSAVSLY